MWCGWCLSCVPRGSATPRDGVTARMAIPGPPFMHATRPAMSGKRACSGFLWRSLTRRVSRCGRVVEPHRWRWTGLVNGVDLQDQISRPTVDRRSIHSGRQAARVQIEVHNGWARVGRIEPASQIAFYAVPVGRRDLLGALAQEIRAAIGPYGTVVINSTPGLIDRAVRARSLGPRGGQNANRFLLVRGAPLPVAPVRDRVVRSRSDGPLG